MTQNNLSYPRVCKNKYNKYWIDFNLNNKRTGSLSKLQKAMGHSSLKVSLTYLRGLEVEDLKEEDMPMI